MTKNLLSFIFVLCITLGVYAQNFTISYPAIQYAGPPNQLLEAPVTVTNTSNSVLHLMAYRKTNNLAPGHESYFCWSINCYGPPTNLSTDTVHLSPGADDNSFKGYLSPISGTDGTNVVEYCFFDYNTPQDSICVTFTYVFDQSLSVGDLSAEQIFSNPYPNPANQYVMFSYDLSQNKKGIIQIHNLLGSIVKKFPLTDKRGVIYLPISDLNAGVYFASLIADGTKLVTRRIVVSHK